MINQPQPRKVATSPVPTRASTIVQTPSSAETRHSKLNVPAPQAQTGHSVIAVNNNVELLSEIKPGQINVQ